MVRDIIACCLVALMALPPAVQAQEAHVHGHGTLDVAVEGTKILLVLEAPGADLVGFEGMGETAEELAAEQTARSALNDALTLFGIPGGAGCTIAETQTSLDRGEHSHEDHSDITAQVALECGDIAALHRLDLSTYFSVFPGSEHLDVRLITPGGSAQQELSAASPVINLSSR